MLRLIAILVLLHSIFCNKVSDNIHIENEKCDNESALWTLIEYESIGIHSPNDSLSGLRANNKCCERVPIDLSNGSVISITVYVKTADNSSGIVIKVIGPENDIIVRHDYKRTSEDFKEGWRTISMHIDKGGPGYINLLGYSRDTEMVLIDSVVCRFNKTSVYVNTGGHLEIIDKEHEEINLKQNEQYMLYQDDIILRNNSEKSQAEILIENSNFRDTNPVALGTWIIVLIVVASVTTTALIATCAYHIGKLRSAKNDIPVVYEEELPKIGMIPRVRGTANCLDSRIQSYL